MDTCPSSPRCLPPLFLSDPGPQQQQTLPLLSPLSSGFDFSLYKSQGPSCAQPEAHHDERPSEPECADRAELPCLARAPSLLERVKSINFSSLYRSSDPDPDEDALHHLGVDSDSEDDDSVLYTDAGRVHQDHQVRRVRSDPKAAAHGESSAWRRRTSPSWSVGGPRRRERAGKRAARRRSSVEGEDEIDAKADAFINRYKRDLKLQRLDSIVRFKEMLGPIFFPP
ncbi:hypothetical protein BT93_H0109 [Corymbia citriodora subsp. variegata]|nr:hypothetical protein BT93_H0109 [Corymbia citriodora subsp. variegata]